MISVDQTDETDKSNIVGDLGDVQSMSIVTTQPKLITNGRSVNCQKVEVCLTYLMFCNLVSHKSARE